MKHPNSQTEKSLLSQGYRHVVGLDEAGRGAWAGPVVAAGLRFEAKRQAKGFKIQDSKLLTPAQRERSFEFLTANFDYGIGVVAAEIIDAIGIVAATKLAMAQALAHLAQPADYLLIDALRLDDWSNIPQSNLIRGDQKIWSIAAASIIAKVARDRIMNNYHRSYRLYHFNQNKGYGTRFHLTVIRAHGPSPLHRFSYQPIKIYKNIFESHD